MGKKRDRLRLLRRSMCSGLASPDLGAITRAGRRGVVVVRRHGGRDRAMQAGVRPCGDETPITCPSLGHAAFLDYGPYGFLAALRIDFLATTATENGAL